jgi:hypothetical protein
MMNALRDLVSLGFVWALSLGLGGCSLSTLFSSSAEVRNLFTNGSFEQGTAPWFALSGKQWEGFSVTERHAKAGKYSAYLALRATPETEGSKVFGLIQEVSPKKFPEKISGYYRVENWHRGTDKQYLQFVVIIQGDSSEARFENYQIRYILAGVETPPLKIANARYIFLGGREPKQREWVRFEQDLQADFQRKWGRIPTRFTQIRILFEARYDEKKADDNRIFADVYYDNLFLSE